MATRPTRPRHGPLAFKDASGRPLRLGALVTLVGRKKRAEVVKLHLYGDLRGLVTLEPPLRYREHYPEELQYVEDHGGRLRNKPRTAPDDDRTDDDRALPGAKELRDANRTLRLWHAASARICPAPRDEDCPSI